MIQHHPGGSSNGRSGLMKIRLGAYVTVYLIDMDGQMVHAWHEQHAPSWPHGRQAVTHDLAMLPA